MMWIPGTQGLKIALPNYLPNHNVCLPNNQLVCDKFILCTIMVFYFIDARLASFTKTCLRTVFLLALCFVFYCYCVCSFVLPHNKLLESYLHISGIRYCPCLNYMQHNYILVWSHKSFLTDWMESAKQVLVLARCIMASLVLIRWVIDRTKRIVRSQLDKYQHATMQPSGYHRQSCKCQLGLAVYSDR